MAEDQTEKTLRELDEHIEETGIKYRDTQSHTQEAAPGVVQSGADSIKTTPSVNGDK